jgi:hypothetical protein
LLQDRDDLFFAVSCAFHERFSSSSVLEKLSFYVVQFSGARSPTPP